MVVATVLFLSPVWMAVAGVLLAATVGVAAARRLRLGRVAASLVAGGGACWVAAAGSPAWDRPAPRRVAVLVDLSPSTRGATYRDRATLDRRVGQLLGATPFDLLAFAGGPPRPLPDGPVLADLPCDRTAFAPPPDADAVVLFSDGRFTPPAVAPPTYPILDANLATVTDAAVRRLRWSGDGVAATVAGRGTLRWTGATPPSVDVDADQITVATATADAVTAAVDGGDLWPENDRLSIRRPPPATAERWWVGTSPAPARWRAVPPSQLPTDPAAYLAAGVVVLDDVPADALSPERQRLLAGHVRDLGGGLVIGGGPHAFAAGGYGSTPLDAVSPLASDPPTPAERWVVLVDGSGSMATAGGWATECEAVRQLLPALPAADRARVGSFAATVHWWADEATPGELAAAPLPPAGVGPNGPTNLASAVRAASAAADPNLATHLLLMTDADADLPDAAGLSDLLRSHHVHLHLLATGNGSAAAALRAMSAETGGSVVEQSNPAGWVAAARQLARSATPRRFVAGPADVRWTGLAGPGSVVGFNQMWLKPTADPLATAGIAPLAARWSAGSGHAAAVAFAADAALLVRLADTVAAAPRDPRFGVTVDAGPTVVVAVDAVDGTRTLNGLAVTLSVDGGPAAPVGQVGPGLYRAEVPAPPRPAVAAVAVSGRVIERLSVAGRYPPEFDAVGTDPVALAALAEQTGGSVVGVGGVGPIRFAGPPRRTDLSPLLATGGAALVLAGLVRWRRS